ncbi:MAG: hypothetical protein UT10_C0013G0012 [Candidatus Woesebacteria bacterium GW2011_GWB1_38_8b]|uniref:Uncharacterized protein n=2 Tax=Candidatus Woeseibacteriota TaxID=1752722 RepID=A0A0G0L4P1_9BACT|nr:MAG: hypothetical protein UT10_C0013G0012 [Candidatus Woesebacteria bacterium GW2011_GWB1_38_8b]
MDRDGHNRFIQKMPIYFGFLLCLLSILFLVTRVKTVKAYGCWESTCFPPMEDCVGGCYGGSCCDDLDDPCDNHPFSPSCNDSGGGGGRIVLMETKIMYMMMIQPQCQIQKYGD